MESVTGRGKWAWIFALVLINVLFYADIFNNALYLKRAVTYQSLKDVLKWAENQKESWMPLLQRLSRDKRISAPQPGYMDMDVNCLRDS